VQNCLLHQLLERHIVAAASLSKISENAQEFGLKTGKSGPHSSRTIALDELSKLLDALPVDADLNAYRAAVVDANLLDKSTDSNRKASFRRLRELYALDPTVPLFRVFRKLWDLDAKSRPQMALLMAFARDPLFRASAPTVLKTHEDAELIRQALCDALDKATSGRMSGATIDKVARNVSSSWSQTGHLVGRVRKIRHLVTATPVSITFALILAFVSGSRGKKLLTSDFIQALDTPPDIAKARSIDARRLGLIELRESDDVFDVGFRRLLTERELRIANGTN
jgi:hypothetical protein